MDLYFLGSQKRQIIGRHDGLLSGVSVGRASHTTRKSRHVLYLSIVVHLQEELHILITQKPC